MARDFEDLRDRLLAISEELAERSIDLLQQAIHDGGTKPPIDERRLTRARRAVEKAANLLADEPLA